MKYAKPSAWRLGSGIASMAAVLVFGAGSVMAQNNLKAIGPVDPVTKFPAWVQDSAQQQVGPCDVVNPDDTNPGAIINSPPCPGLELNDPFGTFTDPNIAEFTYWRGEANMPTGLVANPESNTPAGERFRLRMEVQGGVLPPGTINNAIRLRMRLLSRPGLYKIYYPLMPKDTNNNPIPFEYTVAPGEVNVDIELPGGSLGQEPNWADAMRGNIVCFWNNGSGSGPQYLGDGITQRRLRPIRNNPACPQGTGGQQEFRFAVQFPPGPGGEPGPLVWTEFYTVEGKLYDNNGQPGVLPERVTYTRDGSATKATVDAWAFSIANTQIPVTGTGVPGSLEMVEARRDRGNYYARFDLNDPNDVPSTISIAGASVAVEDQVIVTRADYDAQFQRIFMSAVSSDQLGPVTFVAKDEDGRILSPANWDGSLHSVTAGDCATNPDTGTNDCRSRVNQFTPPRKIMVTSSKGGTATVDVVLTGNRSWP